MYLRFFDKQILNMSSKLVEVFPNYVYVKKEFQRNYRSERVSHAGSCAVIRSSVGLHDYMVTWFCVNPLCRSMWLRSCVVTLLHSYQWLIQDFPDGARAPTPKVGVLTYYIAFFYQKLHENERILTPLFKYETNGYPGYVVTFIETLQATMSVKPCTCDPAGTSAISDCF